MNPRRSYAILVVEDEPDLAVTCERLLRRRGYDVMTAGSRRDGLSMLEKAPPALVITDLRLPDGDGLDVVRAARRATAPIPAIVITGFASEASRQAALAAGAAGYLSKPFSTVALTMLVEQALGARGEIGLEEFDAKKRDLS